MGEIFRSLVVWFNTTFRLTREDRLILYEMMEIQLSQGISLPDVLMYLINDVPISKDVRELVFVGHQAIEEGRYAFEGMAETNMLPEVDVYLLITAEKNGVVGDVLKQLQGAETEAFGFCNKVIFTNSYYLLILGFLIFMVLQVERMAERLKGYISLDTNSLYLLSVMFNDMFWWALSGLIAMCLVIWFISNHVYHPLRYLLPFFSSNIQMQYGIKFCGVSSLFYRTDGTHKAAVAVAMDVFVASGFMRGALRDLQSRYEIEGELYTDVLGRTVLPKGVGAIIKGMLPGDSRDGAAKAFRAAEMLQISLLKKRYSRAKALFQGILMCVIGYLMVSMAEGLYTLYEI